MMIKCVVIILIFLMAPLALAVGAFMQNRLPWNEPPGFSKRLQVYLTTNQAKTSVDAEFPELEVRVYPFARDKLFSIMEQVVIFLGWEIRDSNRERFQIHAVATTPLWHFLDDIYVMLLPAGEGNRTRVDVHAKSRSGKGDFGTNTRHILDLYSAVENKLGEQGQGQNR